MIYSDRYCASFRIIDDHLDPLEITKLLGIEPEEAHLKGDVRVTISKKGKQMVHAPYKFGRWSISSKEPDYLSLSYHLNSLLQVLYPLKDRLIELSSRGYKMDMFCGAFLDGRRQSGFEIDSDILLKLGEIKTSIGLCMYPIWENENENGHGDDNSKPGR